MIDHSFVAGAPPRWARVAMLAGSTSNGSGSPACSAAAAHRLALDCGSAS